MRSDGVFLWLISLCWLFISVLTHDALADKHKPDILVESVWLSERLGQPDLLVVDVRDREEYAKGHILGAINIPVSETFGIEPRTDLLAPIDHIRTLFQQAGVNQDSRLVLYDDGRGIDAARVFWALEVFGHTKLGVLDGGFETWGLEARAVSAKPVNLPMGNFVPTLNPDALSTKFSVRLGMNNPARVLVDVRSQQEYMGTASSGPRNGHIEGAISIPWSVNFVEGAERGKLRPLDQLRSAYEAFGVSADQEVTAYCNKGKQSALTYLVLRRLGYQVSVYDGSWYEWSRDESLPIVSPTTKAIGVQTSN